MNQSKKGFTLVEIMIVVVIIGLLAAMAIPAFQKVRENSIEKTIVNDARQLASGAQQYMMENGVTTATVTVNTTDGSVGGVVSDWVKQVSKSVTFTGETSGTISQGETFTMTSSINTIGTNGVLTFDEEGKKQ